MTSFDIERRKMLQASGAALLTGLAGCTGILADGTGVPGKSPPVEESGENGENNVPPEVDDWLSDANEYEGELADHTGEDEVVIEVGAGSSGIAFNEPAVQVDPGTTIVWEWTGNGGNHNVVEQEVDEPAFDSRREHDGNAIGEGGFQYQVTLEEERNYRYVCTPHQAVGMFGAIVVGGDSGGGSEAPAEVGSYLEENEANGYDGSVVDETDSDSVTIAVGAGGQGLAFDPAAVVVSAGTEVTWEWTGEGGGHNVEVNEGPTEFTSETVEEEGHTFSQELEAGNYLYQCGPHSTLGMHGAVIVEEE